MLHDSILERMKGNHGQTSTRTEYPALSQRLEASYPVEKRFRGLLADADVRLRRWRGLVSSPPAAD